jgi:hypothetical protein
MNHRNVVQVQHGWQLDGKDFVVSTDQNDANDHERNARNNEQVEQVSNTDEGHESNE